MTSVQLYTVEDVCELLRIGRTRLYELIESGALKSIKIGKSTRFQHDELVRFISVAAETV